MFSDDFSTMHSNSLQAVVIETCYLEMVPQIRDDVTTQHRGKRVYQLL